MIGKKVIEFGKCKSLTSDKTMVAGRSGFALLKLVDSATCSVAAAKIRPKQPVLAANIRQPLARSSQLANQCARQYAAGG